MRKLLALTLTALLAAAAATGLPATSAAAGAADATVTTDKTDYQPGETVVISGSGFEAGETVNITLKEDPASHPDTQLSATADEYGNFVNKDFSPTQEHLGVSFALKAVGQSSGRTAEASFNDGPNWSYSSIPNPATFAITTDGLPHSVNATINVIAPDTGTGKPSALNVITVAPQISPGANPIPNSWLSPLPNLTFNTSPQTLPWNVTVTVPPYSAAGTYSTQIKANPPPGKGGAGPGITVTVTVTADNAAPNTALSAAKADTTSYNGVDWTNQDVTVTLSATDTGTPTTGVASTKYNLDSGGYQTYSAPFTISSQGLHTLLYQSQDFQGNIETPAKSFTIKIDKTKPVITLSGAADMTVVYGSGPFSDPGASATDSGGSGLADPVSTSGSVNTSIVGDYTLNYDVSDKAGNAADTVSRTVHVIKAEQTIDFGALADKAYGDPDFTVSATAGSGDAVVFSAAGDCTISGSSVHITGAGSCTITADEDGNAFYNAAPSVQQSFNIAKATAAINVSGYTGTYDGQPHSATGMATGVLGEDLGALLHLGSTFTNVPGGTAVWAFDGNNNYNSDGGSVAIVINPAPLTVTASSPAAITYGDAAPMVSHLYSGFVNGETGSVLTTQPTCGTTYAAGSDAGVYPTTCSGASAANYQIGYVAGSLTVNKKLLTVTADDKSKIYDGQPYSPFTVQYSGFVLGQNQSVLGGTLAFSTSPSPSVNPGTYTITPGGLSSNNYSFNYVNGTLTINAWTLKGFYSPVQMSLGSVVVWNNIKGGQTVPLKFNLYAGATEKTSTADVRGFTVTLVPCSAGIDVQDDPNGLLSTTGGTAFRYSGTPGLDGQFIQNWATPNTSGKCYKVTMTALDYSTISAFFKTK